MKQISCCLRAPEITAITRNVLSVPLLRLGAQAGGGRTGMQGRERSHIRLRKTVSQSRYWGKRGLRQDWGPGLPGAGGQKAVWEEAGIDPGVWAPPVQRGAMSPCRHTAAPVPAPALCRSDGAPAVNPTSRVLEGLPARACLRICALAWAGSGDPSRWSMTLGSAHSSATWPAPHL